MIDDGDIVTVFESVHRVMKAEKILKASLQGVKVIPMPRQLRADCGMAIKFPQQLLDEVKRLLEEKKVPVIEFWCKRDGELCLLPEKPCL